MRIELDDGSATIRDPRKLPGRLAEMIEDAQLSFMATEAGTYLTDETKSVEFQAMSPAKQMALVGVEGVHKFRDLNYMILTCYVTEWTYDGVVQEVSRPAFEEVPQDFTRILGSRIGDVIKATGGPKVDTTPSTDMATPSVPSNT